MLLKINDRIKNRQVEFFNNFSLNLKYDSVGSAFGFSFYFEPENKEHKELMCIGHYHTCTVEHNNELLLSGIILSQAFQSSTVRKMVSLGGYSLPGVLEDSTIPVSTYPLQHDGLSLKQIAEKLIRPFGLTMKIDNSVASKMNAVFDISTAKETQTVKSYLTELATQKNIIISHNEKGELLFTSANTNQTTPLLEFDFSAGTIPGTEMDLNFNGQAMHSHITVQKQANVDADSGDAGNAAEATVRNPYVINSVFRPLVVSQSSGKDTDTEQAAKNIRAAELKNLKLVIKTDRWEVNGKIIKPNNYLTVINPEVYLYKKTTWFIEEIAFSGDEKQTTAVLTCCLPSVYNGEEPKYLFAGINLH